MSESTNQIQQILEIVEFIKDNAASKQEVAELRSEMATKVELANMRSEMATKVELANMRSEMATKVDLYDLKSEVITHVDGLAVLHQRLDTELAALRAKYERLQMHVHILAKHANITLEM